MALPLDQIKKSSASLDDTEHDFVGIGVLNQGSTASHSGLIIKFKTKVYEFHYTGQEVLLLDLSEVFYHKIINVIPSFEIAAFLIMAQNIQKYAKPNYGCFYSGEFYDADGNHFSNITGQYMTCVGFCLNVLRGFLQEDYLKYEDWDNTTADGFLNQPDYFSFFILRHGLDPDEFSSSLRRITPIEMLTSAFFNDLPISKANIDSHKAQVNNILQTIDI
jgi:hypothetical protein